MLNRVLDFFRGQGSQQPIPWSDRRAAVVLARFPVLVALDQGRRNQVLGRAREILASKTFVGGSGYRPSVDDCLSVALLAALPVLNRGLAWYGDFHTFVLYPEAFLAELEEVDDDGLIHRSRDLRAGEAWNHGPVILAMSDVWASGQGEGFNVVVHELAHQIDHRNGEANGFPPLPAGMAWERWTKTFSAAYADLLDQIEHGREPGLDPYAAESPAEFFAVASEVYFDLPEWLPVAYPELHAELSALYGPWP
ncbi:MAG: zinc-dependent peptidase [Wenzhouxiangella sp.]